MVSIFWILAGIGLFFLSVLLNKSGVNKKKLLREAYEDALKSKNKKIALHRLLYCNFIEPLNDNEYLKFTCNNKGKCCSLKHLKKFSIEPTSKFYNVHKIESIPINKINPVNDKISKNTVYF